MKRTPSKVHDSKPLHLKRLDSELRKEMPFPNLNSLLVSATILSYLGYEWEVKEVMLALSKNCRAYFKKQKLKGFLVGTFVPRELQWVINFKKDIFRT